MIQLVKLTQQTDSEIKSTWPVRDFIFLVSSQIRHWLFQTDIETSTKFWNTVNNFKLQFIYMTLKKKGGQCVIWQLLELDSIIF